jgi:multicomponent Na+:H+ antiporter subunit C
MTIPYAILVGLLFAVAIYLLLRRSIVDLIFGLILLSHAANLLVFGGGRLVRGAPPLLDDPGQPAIADPLPQALVLTAIVIGFGIVAFAMVLVSRLYIVLGTDDSAAMQEDRDA